MQIRFAFGPHAGEIRNMDRTTVVDLLLESGVLEAVPLAASAQPREAHPVNAHAPQWSVGRRGADLVIVCATGRDTLYYTGSPTGALEHFAKAGREIPNHILAEYSHLVEIEKDPQWLADQRQSKRDTLTAEMKRANGGQ